MLKSCKAMSALMLRAAAVVDRVKTQAPFPPAQLSTLAQMTSDLHAGNGNMTQAHIQHRNFPSHHIHLLQSFATAVQALVAKMALLSSDTTERIGANSMVLNTGVSLWALLYTVCNNYHEWPSAWPVSGTPAEYASVRSSLKAMMSLLLRMTRGGDSNLQALLACMRPEARHKHISTILAVPHSYMKAVGQRPISGIVDELSSLHSEFIPMLCCLLCEQLGGVNFSAGTVARAAAGASPAAAAEALGNNPSILIPCLVRTLTNILVHLGVDNNQDYVHIFATPSVIELHKQALLTHLVQQRTAPPEERINILHEYATTAFLTRLLSIARDLNLRAAAHLTFKAFCAADDKVGDHLLPLYRPQTPSCDILLLHELYRHRCDADADARLVKLRGTLLHALMLGWRDDRVARPHLPFASPTARDQAGGMYVSAYNCSVELTLWMEQQRFPRGFAGAGVDGRPALATGVRSIMTLVFTNSMVCQGISELKIAAPGGWESGPRQACVWLLCI